MFQTHATLRTISQSVSQLITVPVNTQLPAAALANVHTFPHIHIYTTMVVHVIYSAVLLRVRTVGTV